MIYEIIVLLRCWFVWTPIYNTLNIHDSMAFFSIYVIPLVAPHSTMYSMVKISICKNSTSLHAILEVI
jgi:hypothetical protein